jgi:hypothetical protein
MTNKSGAGPEMNKRDIALTLMVFYKNNDKFNILSLSVFLLRKMKLDRNPKT